MELKTIQQWIEIRQAEITELELRLAPQLEELDRLRQDIRLLEELALRADPNGALHKPADREQARPSRQSAVAEAVHDVLRDQDGPLHISEIRRRMLERGHPIPGRGEDANLIVHISKDNRIARVGRGMYDLVERGATPLPARKPRRKTRRHASSRRRT